MMEDWSRNIGATYHWQQEQRLCKHLMDAHREEMREVPEHAWPRASPVDGLSDDEAEEEDLEVNRSTLDGLAYYLPMEDGRWIL